MPKFISTTGSENPGFGLDSLATGHAGHWDFAALADLG